MWAVMVRDAAGRTVYQAMLTATNESDARREAASIRDSLTLRHPGAVAYIREDV